MKKSTSESKYDDEHSSLAKSEKNKPGAKQTKQAKPSGKKDAVTQAEKELRRSLGRWNTDGGRNVQG